jgi:hypothetical protein
MRPSCYTTPASATVRWSARNRWSPGLAAAGEVRQRDALEDITARLFADFPPEDLATAGRVLTIITTRANAELADPELSWAARAYPHDRTQAAGDQLRLLDRPAD